MIITNHRAGRYVSIIAISFLILFATVSLHADASLTAKLDACLNDPALAHGIQGVVVQSLKDGTVIYERNPDLALIPASNLKLIVSAAALDMIGPDARLKTSLYITGPISRDGILKGDVILQGGGDPVFSSEQLAEMSKSLWRLGVKTVTGSLIADDSMFDDTRLGIGWSWDYESYGYAAQISALNLDGNSIKVWVYPGKKIGSPAIVKLVPSTSYTAVKNSCVTASKEIEKKVSIDRLHGRNVISVSGIVPLGYTPAKAEEILSVDDPTSFVCRMFIASLKRMGISVKGGIRRGICPPGSRFISSIDSPPISEMIKAMNKSSVNLIAECLLKTLGYRVNGEGKASAGHKAERDFLQRTSADMTAVSLIDGSGLSRSNYISSRNIATLLKFMYAHKYSKQFIDSLPIAGIDGTLKNRMKGTSAEGVVKAKTGYVSAVCVISGYAALKSGEPIAFCIMMNNHLCTNKEAQAIQDQMITAITD
ncbi:MAG: D-alanyl-D-alanine carboxypeptidase/D-alanyl-D-alanine endopeptidase [Armatimonadota bacterium]